MLSFFFFFFSVCQKRMKTLGLNLLLCIVVDIVNGMGEKRRNVLPLLTANYVLCAFMTFCSVMPNTLHFLCLFVGLSVCLFCFLHHIRTFSHI